MRKKCVPQMRCRGLSHFISEKHAEWNKWKPAVSSSSEIFLVKKSSYAKWTVWVLKNKKLLPSLISRLGWNIYKWSFSDLLRRRSENAVVWKCQFLVWLLIKMISTRSITEIMSIPFVSHFFRELRKVHASWATIRAIQYWRIPIKSKP